MFNKVLQGPDLSPYVFECACLRVSFTAVSAELFIAITIIIITIHHHHHHHGRAAEATRRSAVLSAQKP